jgi:predicted enzyme related to lactoylglutathione lyase
MQGQLNFVILHVRDIAAARDFYAKTFDLELEGESADFVQFNLHGGATFALQRDEHPAPTAGVELWWQSPDVDAHYEALKGRGVEIVSAPQDMPFGRTLSIKDLEGNVVNLWRPRQA